MHTRTNTGMHAYTCATRSPNHPCLRHRLVCRPQNIHEECYSPHKHKLHLDLYSAFSPRARIRTHTHRVTRLPVPCSKLSALHVCMSGYRDGNSIPFLSCKIHCAEPPPSSPPSSYTPQFPKPGEV